MNSPGTPAFNTPDVDVCDVWVLGGGITGLTTAIVLQSVGLRVAILSEFFPGKSADMPKPCVPTGYAMASAYPHHLQIDNLHDISRVSQTTFARLASLHNSPVSIYRIFEVFEQEPAAAPLASERMKMRHFEGSPARLRLSLNPPSRPGAKYLWGWDFLSFFADMPYYLTFLWETFLENEGVRKNVKLNLQEICKYSESRPVINCLGYGAVELMDDRCSHKIVRGRQVIVHGAALVRGSDGIPLSYNYTPSPEVYRRADGNSEYVHFFPRRVDWVLGQTREPGYLDDQLNWHGQPVRCNETQLNGIAIPLPILTLNNEILQNWLGLELRNRTLTGREGFRYYRDPEETGVRLDFIEIDGTPIFNNYGHGGSGVTMSWGCAVECARRLIKICRPSISPAAVATDSLTKELQQEILRH